MRLRRRLTLQHRRRKLKKKQRKQKSSPRLKLLRKSATASEELRAQGLDPTENGMPDSDIEIIIEDLPLDQLTIDKDP
jgi:hypothetical protein